MSLNDVFYRIISIALAFFIILLFNDIIHIIRHNPLILSFLFILIHLK